MCCCKKSFAQKGLFFGALFALIYVISFFWYFAVKAPVLQEMFLNCFRVSFIWWNGMDFASFVSGLIQSFIGGWILVILLWLSCKICGCQCENKCETPKA